jgi:hypothetical protein
MKPVSPSAIVEMLTPEGAESQVVKVIQHDLRGIGHLETMMMPPVTEVAIF